MSPATATTSNASEPSGRPRNGPPKERAEEATAQLLALERHRFFSRPPSVPVSIGGAGQPENATGERILLYEAPAGSSSVHCQAGNNDGAAREPSSVKEGGGKGDGGAPMRRLLERWVYPRETQLFLPTGAV